MPDEDCNQVYPSRYRLYRGVLHPFDQGIIVGNCVTILLKQPNYFQGWTFAQVFAVLLIAGAESNYLWVCDCGNRLADLCRGEGRHAVIHPARRSNEGRAFRSHFFQEPWVDGNAMAADPNSCLQNIHAGVSVRKCAHHPCVGPEYLTDL